MHLILLFVIIISRDASFPPALVLCSLKSRDRRSSRDRERKRSRSRSHERHSKRRRSHSPGNSSRFKTETLSVFSITDYISKPRCL